MNTEFGYSISFDSVQKRWTTKLLRDGAVSYINHYPFETDIGRERAFENALLDGHIYVTTHAYLFPFGMIDPVTQMVLND